MQLPGLYPKDVDLLRHSGGLGPGDKHDNSSPGILLNTSFKPSGQRKPKLKENMRPGYTAPKSPGSPTQARRRRGKGGCVQLH